jgi:hypothetical protein
MLIYSQKGLLTFRMIMNPRLSYSSRCIEGIAGIFERWVAVAEWFITTV